QFSIGVMCAVVGILDVKSQADDIGGRAGLSPNLSEQHAKDASAAVRLSDVHALEPPNPPFAPVAPFPGDGGLAYHLGWIVDLRDPVTKAVGIGQRGGHARIENREFEHFPFGLQGKATIELDDYGTVAAAGLTDDGSPGRVVVQSRSLRRMRAR